MDNHTSVVGLRNLVWSRGGDVFVLVENEEEEWTSVKVNDCGAKIKTKKKWFKGNKSNPAVENICWRTPTSRISTGKAFARHA